MLIPGSKLLLLLSFFHWSYISAQNLEHFYPKSQGELVEHKYYSLDYNESHEQANWVIYFAGNTGITSRNDNFKADPLVSTKSAQLSDFSGSGYDRGHLAPAADMNVNSTAMRESFYLSNMSPQLPSFNRGIWKKLEALVRDWANNNDSKFDVIVTGPVLTNMTCGSIGNGVTVPCAYYKIYADLESGRSIGFILPNQSSSSPLSSFVVSINEIEDQTGIDFFYLLEDDQEEVLESQSSTTNWSWSITNSTPKTKAGNDISTSQCSATTQSGSRCKRKASEGSDTCWQHD
ncbi:MAG: DNA/RNA non-specific endonuclease [Cyclobacteriaceae bacterium]